MPEVRPADLTQQAVQTARRWLAEAAAAPVDRDARRLAAVLRDPEGLDFTVGFVDRVMRPEDPSVAAANLDRLSRSTPASLPWHIRAAVAAGGGFGPLAPRSVIPVARRAFRGLVQHLLLDATPDKLGPALAALTSAEGVRPVLAPLGEAVLGDAGADRRLAEVRALLERDDVEHVSIPVASVVGPRSPWGTDETSAAAVERLTPLYELALASSPPKVIDLDLGAYRDLDLTIDVFTRLLDQPQLLDLEAGIVVQGHLPDALASVQLLTDWARGRVARGGSPIRVRLVTGADRALELVESRLTGWPLATYRTDVETGANVKRVLDWALRPVNAEVVHVAVATHDLFDVAHAWVLARQREVTHLVSFEMPLGVATAAAEAVRREIGAIDLHAPVVRPGEFDTAVGYLVRRLDELTSPGDHDAAAIDAHRAADDDAHRASDDPRDGAADDSAADSTAPDEQRYLDACALLEAQGGADVNAPGPARRQDRTKPARRPAVLGAPGQAGAADPAGGARPVTEPATDPALERNRTWARRLLVASRTSHAGVETVGASRVLDAAQLEAVVAATAQAGASWGHEPAATRAELLDRVADALAAHRADLIEVMTSEVGTTVGEGDREVGEAIDLARLHAHLARELDDVTGARWAPPRLTVVVPPWASPVAVPSGGVTAALAAGSGVVLKPAPQARRSAAVLAETLWGAGVPRELLALVELDEDELGRDLVAHPAVDRVVLTGTFETAETFRAWRPDLPLAASTAGGGGSVVVTPAADLDLAVADVVEGAFGRAGQSCTSGGLVILVGSAARSERFRRQLVDAVASLVVGWPDEPTTQVGPLVDPAEGRVLEALTVLSPGESWLVEPRQLDEEGVLWSPGIRDGVLPGSAAHLDQALAPVLGVMHAETLDEAVRLQNQLERGLVAGLHSLDVDEVRRWLDGVEAGTLAVDRPVTGAVVGRRPVAGWGRATVGPVVSVGGPNAVIAHGTWWAVAREPHPSLRLTGVGDRVVAVIEAARSGLSFEQFDRVRAGAASDELAWQAEFGVSRDAAGLQVERDVLRYRPVPVVLRLSEGADPADLVRLVAAAARVRAPISISAAEPVTSSLVQLLRSTSSPVRLGELTVEGDQAFRDRAAAGLLQSGQGRAAAPDDLELLALATGAGAASTTADPEARAESGAPVAHRGLRIRLVGGDARALAAALGGDPDVTVWSGDVTEAGRVELLPFLREQSVSLTAHRFGAIDPDFRDLRL